MKRYLPILSAVALVLALAVWVVSTKSSETVREEKRVSFALGKFDKEKNCARPPAFLSRLHIPQPVIIDLSQKRYKGMALLYGKGFKKVLHPIQWEQYEHFSTYALDERGNIYLAPTPFISIHPTTFNLQKKIFRLDTKTGKISIWMDIDDVHPSPQNPYGVNSIAYDCDDKTLWVSAIDESDYQHQKGEIYHIDPDSKKILHKIEGFDAFTLAILHAHNGKFLLAGSARDNCLYAFKIQQDKLSDKPIKLLEIPDPNEHIRRIKIKGPNHLELQTIPFTYSMIARTAKKDRTHYDAFWHPDTKLWSVIMKQ